ncbi:MAG: putative membrane-anchored protein [Yoonia sp.]
MKTLIGATLYLASIVSATQAETLSEFFPEVYNDLSPEYQEESNIFNFQQGQITLPGGAATLNVGPNHYFIDADQAKLVVEEFWRNPKGQPFLGMIFPREISPYYTGGWGLTVEFEDIGYVSDKEAADYNYDELLSTMQKDIVSESAWRKENGFDRMELIGWAAPPRYDAQERKLHWAKHLRFGDSESDTLNYNIRALGRNGVLILNFIANIDELPAVATAAPEVMAMVSFTQGNRYADFKPGIDKVAAVGIGGLIAGKVIAKTGLLVTLLLVFKKAWFLIFIPIVWLKNKFSGRKDNIS